MSALRRIAVGFTLTFMTTASAFAAGAPVEQASKEQWSAAQKTFLAAGELYDAKRYDESITAYRASWNIVASPNTRLQIARALRELDRVPEAYEEMLGVLADAERDAAKDEKYERTASAAREELAALGARVALLRITLRNVPEGMSPELDVSGRAVPLAALGKPVAATPGAINVTVRVQGREPVVRSITLAAAQSGELTVDLAAGPAGAEPVAGPPTAAPPLDASSSRASLRPYAYVAGGIGAAGLATFAVFGLMNNSKFSELEADCPGGRCAAGKDAEVDTGRQYQTIANIGLVVGAVGLAAGTVLFVLEPKPESGARVSLGLGTVAVQGRF